MGRGGGGEGEGFNKSRRRSSRAGGVTMTCSVDSLNESQNRVKKYYNTQGNLRYFVIEGSRGVKESVMQRVRLTLSPVNSLFFVAVVCFDFILPLFSLFCSFLSFSDPLLLAPSTAIGVFLLRYLKSTWPVNRYHENDFKNACPVIYQK